MKLSYWLSPILRLLAKASLVLIPLSFIFGGAIYPRLHAALQVRVDPAFAGGPLLATYCDALGDDAGSGGLSYPLHEAFAGGGLADLAVYEVRRPLVNAAWSEPADFWQLDVTLSQLANPFSLASGFSGIVVSIYIDIDGPSGSSQTEAARGEYVAFPLEAAWDFMVRLDGSLPGGAELITVAGQRQPLTCFVVTQTATLAVRIPLDLAETKPVLDGRPTRHWVLCCLADPLAPGGIMAVREAAGLRSGGGAASLDASRVYDLIAPDGRSQAELLAAAPDPVSGLVVLPPLEVPGFDPLVSYRSPRAQASRSAAAQRLEELRLAAAAESEADQAAWQAQQALDLASADRLTRAVALFGAGRSAEAEAAFDSLLQADPDAAEALAYKGSLMAMRGGQTNPAQAVALVQAAFQLLDRAVALSAASGPEGARQAALLNRANVAAAVPEAVFGKLVQAAADFEAVAALLKAGGQPRGAAGYYLEAALCLEKAGRDQAARTMFLRALSLAERPARVELELARRGYRR
ncbi:MAG: hypothetical protein A2087_14660 [Spirochaetes bacterium GWD1_61_31]|nr:MAG: hypothetical protein A2Y37_09330 [Spirochaetes bacterium GWB1_60_80]OHD31619.1 MAG: hypothetical protein A2004_09545 [Spirochaetes bacterium GWC1_61_12]OHD35017.1 MAG: hypothetical protein A2087_14660 [Spirochaetes bacterium GWD1_61_31]OHD44035.1 MAG: hypothetical protein A2Y35_01720 [Spirochaetes bacterium GWE1_60_18]OHD59070.1 MAG: hypothetical protein A2Y32_02440 [Spirochaetes bacterium GWF1_60_12]HAP42601.1 hypothetical protein [Spirochaetaceae bacterium]